MSSRQRTISTPSNSSEKRNEQNTINKTNECSKPAVIDTSMNTIKTPFRKIKSKETIPIHTDTNKKARDMNTLENKQQQDVNNTKKRFLSQNRSDQVM
ncbi:hypothetical protein GWI33_014438 [Rhynchophorus ferrugineus]|uniref:Uncharacterized protein n=1 Tax=Rhynchophorus ferrugineus TaxID=354439 RepID=A0A834M929_RHYFE|nr:hypothetical protein GWI33_014438 [Rhynchophorus ferrugineus]